MNDAIFIYSWLLLGAFHTPRNENEKEEEIAPPVPKERRWALARCWYKGGRGADCSRLFSYGERRLKETEA